MQNQIEIIEVSPRDGIQNEKQMLSLETKLELINRSIEAGASRVEVTSFVNPKRVPQMAQADEICAALPVNPNCKYIGLALNRRGFERACNAQLDEVNYVVVASDTFREKNQGMNTQTCLDTFKSLSEQVTQLIAVGVTIAAVQKRYPDIPIRLHLHNTRNTGIAMLQTTLKRRWIKPSQARL